MEKGLGYLGEKMAPALNAMKNGLANAWNRALGNDPNNAGSSPCPSAQDQQQGKSPDFIDRLRGDDSGILTSVLNKRDAFMADPENAPL